MVERTTVTRESLQRNRERRAKEREKLARSYEKAADALEAIDGVQHFGVIRHLRDEARSWRRTPTW